jgi:PEGA domain-containing protein
MARLTHGGRVVTRTLRLITLFTCLTGLAMLWPADALAQRAVPRPPSRPVPPYARPGGGHYGYGYGYPYYYPSHYYYSPFYFSFGWYGAYGWYPWYGAAAYGYGGYPYYGYYGGYPQYGPYPPYPYYYPRYEAAVDLRIQVPQRNAEVYLDGYIVGRVDDFDGTFQRLRVPYGEHEIAVYLEGYQTIAQKMLFRPGESYKIAEAMRQLPAGQPNEPRPTPTGPPPEGAGPTPPPPPERGEYGRPGGPPPERGGPPPARSDAFGTLSIRVQPGDAEVLVDGEKWDSPQGEGRILVQLGEGTHQIEIRKQGFRTYSTTIRLRRGETLPLNVSLTGGGTSAF